MAVPVPATLIELATQIGSLGIVSAAGFVGGYLFAGLSYQRQHVKGATYDVGSKGFGTYNEFFRVALFHAVRWLTYFAAADILAPYADRLVHGRYFFSHLLDQVGAATLVGLALAATFLAGMAVQWFGKWMALEAQGLSYIQADGQNYRVMSRLENGTFTSDTTSLAQRIQSEKEALTGNDEQIQTYLKSFFGQAAIVAGVAIAIHYFIGKFGDLYIVIPTVMAAAMLPKPLAQLVVVITDRFAYGCGAQFAGISHVKEAPAPVIDIKDVKEQTATGSAGFAPKHGRKKNVGT